MDILISFLFYQLPEAFLLILAALELLGLKTRRPGRLIAAGLVLGVITLVSRHFLFKYGLHTPIVLTGLVFALVFGFNLSFATAITGCFLSFFLLIMGESLLLSPLMRWTKVSFAKMISNPWLLVIFGWVSAGFLILAIIICKISHKCLIVAPEAKNIERTTNG